MPARVPRRPPARARPPRYRAIARGPRRARSASRRPALLVRAAGPAEQLAQFPAGEAVVRILFEQGAPFRLGAVVAAQRKQGERPFVLRSDLAVENVQRALVAPL